MVSYLYLVFIIYIYIYKYSYIYKINPKKDNNIEFHKFSILHRNYFQAGKIFNFRKIKFYQKINLIESWAQFRK